jgi:hypothetical protein
MGVAVIRTRILFTIAPHDPRLDKRIEVLGPDGFRLWVDNDDVPHKVALGGLKKMVKLLNKHWQDGVQKGTGHDIPK